MLVEIGEIVEIYTFDSDLRGRHSKLPRGILGMVKALDEKHIRLRIPHSEEYETGEIDFCGPDYVLPKGEIERIVVYGNISATAETYLGYIDDYLRRKAGRSHTQPSHNQSKVEAPDIVE